LGGVERCVYDISRKLAKRGHDLFVATPNGISSYPIDVDDDRIYRKQYELSSLATIARRLEQLRSLNLDILHIHSYWLQPFINFFMITKPARAIVLSPHLSPSARVNRYRIFNTGKLQKFHPRYQYDHFLGPAVLKWRVDAVICETLAELEFFNNRGVKNTHLITPGVDVEYFTPSLDRRKFRRYLCLADQPLVLSVTRLDPEKGLRDLLRAVPLVMEKIPDVRVVVVGQGPEKNQLAKLAKSLGIDQNVILVTDPSVTDFRRSDSLLPYAYAACDVFVLPSFKESFGMVLLEAMAAKKPIVATNVEGPRFILEHQLESLVSPGDHVRLAEMILRVLTDTTFAKRLSEAGYEIVLTRYDWSNLVSCLEEIYNCVLNNQH
jgi:glycosyltransferase involved in cell wall biosynthesis